MRPKKSLGQNFLMHARIAERIADTAHLAKEDVVLEVGPGTGILTRALLTRAKRVVAVEADGELVERLRNDFADEIRNESLELLHEDVRAFDPARIGGPYHFVANIPYYLTGEIFRQFLTSAHKPLSMTLLVQKEVAERIARQKGKTAKESLLSLSVKAYGVPKYEFTVPRGAFRPAPGVDSAVLRVSSIRGDMFASPKEEARFFEILRAGFAHKRKFLSGNLSLLSGAAATIEALAAAEIPKNARAEDVSLHAWQKLAKIL